MDLASRFQINMALQNIGHMERVEKFADLTIPLLWFEIVSTANFNAINTEFNVPLKLSSKDPLKEVIFGVLHNCIDYLRIITSILHNIVS